METKWLVSMLKWKMDRVHALMEELPNPLKQPAMAAKSMVLRSIREATEEELVRTHAAKGVRSKGANGISRIVIDGGD